MAGVTLEPTDLAPPLLAWFDVHKRDMPWRETRDPYRIWVSEVMLQQTQVETVRRYYDAFLARFPTCAALAAAPLDDVLAAWSGLGYYRRARFLHRGAQVVADEHAGVVPTDPAAFGALPGVGRYTLGAVLSIAHDARLPILDGNVIRVLARLFEVAGDPATTPVKKRLWSLAEAVLPADRVGDFNQSLMELGALVCRPSNPDCAACPLATGCGARASDAVARYPQPRKRKAVPTVERVALALRRPEGTWLMVQRPAEGLLASLYELPSADLAPGDEPAAAAARLARALGTRARLTPGGVAEHVFSHRRWQVHTFAVDLRRGWRGKGLPPSARWVGPQDLAGLGVPTASRKVLRAAGLERAR